MNVNDINKVIPGEKVYDDALSPAFKQIGKSLESVAKTSRFLLAPFDYLAAQHARWERYLEKVAKNIEVENLIEGHPQVVIPTIEGLSLAYENTLLSEFFVRLLSNSIDKTKQEFAHPAFPNIIKQLSHDEAVILFYLKKRSYKLIQISDYEGTSGLFNNLRVILEEIPLDKLIYPQNIWIYMNHLNSLNLAGTWEYKSQEAIFDDGHNQIGVYIYSERKLNEFGLLFVNSCVPEKFEDL